MLFENFSLHKKPLPPYHCASFAHYLQPLTTTTFNHRPPPLTTPLKSQDGLLQFKVTTRSRGSDLLPPGVRHLGHTTIHHARTTIINQGTLPGRFSPLRSRHIHSWKRSQETTSTWRRKLALCVDKLVAIKRVRLCKYIHPCLYALSLTSSPGNRMRPGNESRSGQLGVFC